MITIYLMLDLIKLIWCYNYYYAFSINMFKTKTSYDLKGRGIRKNMK